MEIENVNLIRKIVWSFYSTTGLEWEELFQEACLYYHRALTTYDPSKGKKLTTYVWWSITCELKNYVKRNKKFSNAFLSVPIEEASDLPGTSSYYENNFLESLNEDAKEIVDLIMSFPKIFDMNSPKKARKHIINILISRKWSKEKIESSLQNLKLAFS